VRKRSWGDSPSTSRRTARCHRARPIRGYADNSNVCTHTDLITILLQGCLKAPHIDFFVQSSTGDVSSIGVNDNGQEFVIMQEWVTRLLIGLEIPDTNRAIWRCAHKMAFIGGQTDGADGTGMTESDREEQRALCHQWTAIFE
jgi:hypothetical protein